MTVWGPRGAGSVELDGVSRAFGRRVVVDNVSLRLAAGEQGAIIGANGSGKSTLLRILAGVLTADSGVVSVAGAPAGRGRTAFVPAGDRMLDWRLTARQNLDFIASVAGHDGATRAAGIAWVTDRLDLGDLLGSRVGESSTGQRRRVMLASAFVLAAPVLLLDEPFEDLDPEGQRSLGALFTEWRARGGAIVTASPEVNSVSEPTIDLRLGSGSGGSS